MPNVNQRLDLIVRGAHFGHMDLVDYRLDAAEKRAEAADARMGRIEDKLTEIQLTLANVATKDTVHNWGMAVVIAVFATGLGLGAIMLQASANQLSAFQSGLSAIQAVVAGAQATSPPKHP